MESSIHRDGAAYVDGPDEAVDEAWRVTAPARPVVFARTRGSRGRRIREADLRVRSTNPDRASLWVESAGNASLPRPELVIAAADQPHHGPIALKEKLTMKNALIALAIVFAAAGAQAQVGTAAKEAGKATAETTKQAVENTKAAVAKEPAKSVHKAKAKVHKAKAKNAAKASKAAAKKAAQ